MTQLYSTFFSHQKSTERSEMNFRNEFHKVFLTPRATQFSSIPHISSKLSTKTAPCLHKFLINSFAPLEKSKQHENI